MSNKIKHFGTIDSIEGNCVHVRIQQSSACSSCSIAGHCSSAESKNKIVDIYDDNSSHYIIGEKVLLSANVGVGYIASFYAYFLPMLLMVAALASVYALTKDEAAAAVASLVILIPYGLVLWLFKKRLSRQVSFNIENEEL